MTDRILIGRIKGAHGIRGEVLVTSFAAAPQDLGGYGPLESENQSRTYDLRVIRATPKGVVARVAGVDDRNAAEALAGADLYVARAKLPPPAEDEFYHVDLIGLDAVAPDGRILGHVVAVANYGAGDLIEIRLAGDRRTEFVPFTDACVPTVDIAARRITVVMPAVSPDDGPHTEHDDGDAT